MPYLCIKRILVLSVGLLCFPYRLKYAVTAKLVRCELYWQSGFWMAYSLACSFYGYFHLPKSACMCELIYKSNYYMEHRTPLWRYSFPLQEQIMLDILFPILPCLHFVTQGEMTSIHNLLLNFINQLIWWVYIGIRFF